MLANEKFSDASLFERVAAWPNYPTLESLSDKALRQITVQHGVDFATALFFDRFQNCPRWAPFIQQINAFRRDSSPPPRLAAKLVIVPGALYIERPDMGGDGRLIREVANTFGMQTQLIPVASFGSVAANAKSICAWLRQHLHEPMILISLSKGSADLKMALTAPDAPALFRNVLAWVNVCGPLNGSRMANWVLDSGFRTWFIRWKFRWQKRDFQFITDLRHGNGAPLDFDCPQSSMRVLHLIGFPLRHHVTTRFSRFCHRTLARWGPNDGTTSLADLHRWPGEIYPAWGMDHYFRPEHESRILVAALLRYLATQDFSERNTGLPLDNSAVLSS